MLILYRESFLSRDTLLLYGIGDEPISGPSGDLSSNQALASRVQTGLGYASFH